MVCAKRTTRGVTKRLGAPPAAYRAPGTDWHHCGRCAASGHDQTDRRTFHSRWWRSMSCYPYTAGCPIPQRSLVRQLIEELWICKACKSCHKDTF